MRTFGRYRLVEPLASGGMADVFRAEVTGPEGVVKEVALKLVRGEHARDGAFVRMFVEEARLAARLNHANVVQVYELYEVDGRYGIAMELVRGRHLGQVVERARERGVRLGVPRTVQIGAEVARALAYAHRLADGGRPLGIVHRDVSPHNVLVSFEGEVKLADFGIARAMNQAGLTEPGTVKGKLAYMAPEQARSGPLDARADVFSLGVVLWELCAGRRLFARENELATAAALAGDEPISPPSAWNEEVPPELDAAILAALARDPDRRTRSSQELATSLSAVLLKVARAPEDVDLRAFMQRIFPGEAEAAAAGAPALEPTRVRAPAEARDAAAPPPEETATRTAPRPRRKGRGALAIAAAVVAAAGAGWWGWTRRAPAPPPVASAGPAANPAAPPGAAASPPSSSPETVPPAAPAAEPRAAPPGAAAEPAGPALLRPSAPLDVKFGAKDRFAPERAGRKAILRVVARPWATVEIGGQPLPQSVEPVAEVLLAPGTYEVVATHQGRSRRARVTVRPGANPPVEFDFEPRRSTAPRSSR